MRSIQHVVAFILCLGSCGGHLRGSIEELRKTRRNKIRKDRKGRRLLFGNFFDIPKPANFLDFELDETIYQSTAPTSSKVPREKYFSNNVPELSSCVGMVVSKCIEYIHNAWTGGSLDIQLASLCDPVTRDYRPDRITIFIDGCHIPADISKSAQTVIRKPGIG